MIERAYIVGIEDQCIRRPLGSTPEWLTSTCGGVLGQTEQQLADVVVVITLELQTGPDNALLEGQRLVGDKVRDNLFYLFCRLPRMLECCFKVVWLREVGVGCLCRLDKEVIELGSAPLR